MYECVDTDKLAGIKDSALSLTPTNHQNLLMNLTIETTTASDKWLLQIGTHTIKGKTAAEHQ